jgi:hypothetical protein
VSDESNLVLAFLSDDERHIEVDALDMLVPGGDHSQNGATAAANVDEGADAIVGKAGEALEHLLADEH